ncbi:MAG: AMP-binding protein [Bacteroidia bacterium]|nr:AMP-binding protein [Bacteroidia bacterium]
MKRTFMTERQMNKNILLKDGDYESIRQVLERIASILPDHRILAELDQDKNIVYYTSEDIYEEVMNLGDGLIDAGLKDAHIAIIAENSVRYVLSDICISSGVGVVTPIDREAPVDLLVTLLNKCDADAVICNAKIVKTLEEVMDKCPRVKTLITIDKQKEGYLSYDELVKRGAALKDKSIYRNIKLDLEAPAKILFTSGTTGANKGVVLTNANLAANILNCMDTIMATPENTAMSVLPMHHATEINTHIMTRVASGRLTYINDNMRNMMANMKLFKPNCITIVPMIANAFYKGIWTNAAKLGKAEKLKKGIKISNLLRKFGKDKTHSMFADLFAPFGGNLEFIVCGGSMLNPEVVKGMNDLGVRMENGYGITECGPLISMNSETLTEHLSVGKPCPGLEAKLINVNEEGVGELCIRGKSVAKGYYKDEEATRKVFMEDGFFNTGDSARIDAEGKIFLVGRKKNTIVLENGKNICPEEVENVIESALSYADEVVVYHPEYDGRPVLCVGLYISDDAKRADRDGILSDIKKANGLLPSYKRIDYIEIVDRPYEKTSTRKIKRTLLPGACSGDGIKVF